jgi:hypothetical protein
MTRTLTIAAGVFIGILGVIFLFVFASRAASGWVPHHAADPMTDVITADFRVEARDRQSILSLSCKPGKPVRAIIAANRRLGGYRPEENFIELPARVRFDDDQATYRTAVIGDEMIGLTETTNPRAPDILAQLSAADRFAIQVDPPSGREPFLAIYGISGSRDVIEQLRARCRI